MQLPWAFSFEFVPCDGGRVGCTIRQRSAMRLAECKPGWVCINSPLDAAATEVLRTHLGGGGSSEVIGTFLATTMARVNGKRHRLYFHVTAPRGALSGTIHCAFQWHGGRDDPMVYLDKPLCIATLGGASGSDSSLL